MVEGIKDVLIVVEVSYITSVQENRGMLRFVVARTLLR